MDGEPLFNEAFALYEKARDKQRILLLNHLKKEHDKNKLHKLVIISGGRSGKGRGNYTSGKNISDYNLVNWKWVELIDDENEYNCIISFNMPDIDPNTGNFHALYDRVGIMLTYKYKKILYKTSITTDIDLPLKEEDLKKIVDIIIRNYTDYINNKKIEEEF